MKEKLELTFAVDNNGFPSELESSRVGDRDVPPSAFTPRLVQQFRGKTPKIFHQGNIPSSNDRIYKLKKVEGNIDEATGRSEQTHFYTSSEFVSNY